MLAFPMRAERLGLPVVQDGGLPCADAPLRQPAIALLKADSRRCVLDVKASDAVGQVVVSARQDFSVHREGGALLCAVSAGTAAVAPAIAANAEYLVYATRLARLFVLRAGEQPADSAAALVGGFRWSDRGADIWDVAERAQFDDDALFVEMRASRRSGRSASNVVSLPTSSTLDRMTAFIARAREAGISIEAVDCRREGFSDADIRMFWDLALARQAQAGTATEDDIRLDLLARGAKALVEHFRVDHRMLRQLHRDAGISDAQIDALGEDLVTHSIGALLQALVAGARS